MEKIIWLEKYSVGVEELDFQHKRIFALIDELQEILEKEKKEDCLDLVLQLFEYSNYHLDREEELLEKYKYSEIKKHKSFHDGYRKITLKHLQSCEREKCDIKALTSFLRKWWVDHILKEDKKYIEFFHKNDIF